MLKHKTQILITLLFLGFTAWWISFQHVLAKQGGTVIWFGNTYGIEALVGSIIGFLAAHKWGGYKTLLGKALIFFSFSLLAQEVGQLAYSYYIEVKKIQIPYPSLGDIGYFGSVLLYITAAIYLAKTVGVRFSLQKWGYKLIATVLPIVLLIVSYTILLHHHHYDTTKPLTVFLDAGYPIGEAIYISIGIVTYLLSRRLLGGIMKSGVLLILLALLIQYVADFSFVFTGNRGTYVPGGWVDYIYVVSYFAMSTALLRFHAIYTKAKPKAVDSPSEPVHPNAVSKPAGA